MSELLSAGMYLYEYSYRYALVKVIRNSRFPDAVISTRSIIFRSTEKYYYPALHRDELRENPNPVLVLRKVILLRSPFHITFSKSWYFGIVQRHTREGGKIRRASEATRNKIPNWQQRPSSKQRVPKPFLHWPCHFGLTLRLIKTICQPNLPAIDTQTRDIFPIEEALQNDDTSIQH
jgi:hypothetical protein